MIHYGVQKTHCFTLSSTSYIQSITVHIFLRPILTFMREVVIGYELNNRRSIPDKGRHFSFGHNALHFRSLWSYFGAIRSYRLYYLVYTYKYNNDKPKYSLTSNNALFRLITYYSSLSNNKTKFELVK
jgi:hypothetical protein